MYVKDIKIVALNIVKNKNTGPYSFTVESDQAFKEEIVPIIHILP